jgi:hypothetical protein
VVCAVAPSIGIDNGLAQLSRSREAMARARRRSADLADRSSVTTWREDQIPYLLDLADGVTRMINEETDRRRTPAFRMWWANQDRSAQWAIHEMRTAELKRLERRTDAGVMSWTNLRAADYPNLRVNDGDTVTNSLGSSSAASSRVRRSCPPCAPISTTRTADRGSGTEPRSVAQRLTISSSRAHRTTTANKDH